jgi:hypothetical protein
VRVPRLDGGKMGVLATRSPHRPVPIGLSLVKIESVRGRFVTISGADIVDGSPVVDIKPYLPFCESLPHATAPDWVTEPCEPLSSRHLFAHFTRSPGSSPELCWEVFCVAPVETTSYAHSSLLSHPRTSPSLPLSHAQPTRVSLSPHHPASTESLSANLPQSKRLRFAPQVTEEAPCEPLHIASVGFAAGAEAALQLAWGPAFGL